MQIARQSRIAGQAYVLRTRLRAPGFTLIYARAILGAGIPSMWNVGLYYKKIYLRLWNFCTLELTNLPNIKDKIVDIELVELAQDKIAEEFGN